MGKFRISQTDGLQCSLILETTKLFPDILSNLKFSSWNLIQVLLILVVVQTSTRFLFSVQQFLSTQKLLHAHYFPLLSNAPYQLSLCMYTLSLFTSFRLSPNNAYMLSDTAIYTLPQEHNSVLLCSSIMLPKHFMKNYLLNSHSQRCICTAHFFLSAVYCLCWLSINFFRTCLQFVKIIFILILPSKMFTVPPSLMSSSVQLVCSICHHPGC